VQNERWQKLVKKLGTIGFFVFLFVRIYLIVGASSSPIKAIRNMTGWKQEMTMLKDEAGERPVVFSESYQKASLYAFYANRPGTTYCLLSGFYKYSQFDFYTTENDIQGKDILFVSMDSTLMKDNVRQLEGNLKNWYVRDIPAFNSYSKLEIDADTSLFLLENKVLKVPQITLYNPYSRVVELEKNTDLQTHLQLFIRGKEKWELVSQADLDNLKIEPGETISVKNIRFNLPDSLSGGTHHIYLGVQNGPFLPVHSIVQFDLHLN
jgi:hypothetical protein